MTEKWIISDIYNSFFLRPDGKWSRKLEEAEVFETYAAAFVRSSQRQNRYPRQLFPADAGLKEVCS